MNRFLKKILLFLIPVFLLSIVPLFILWISKENFYDIDNLNKINDKEYLVGFIYSENNYRYLKYYEVTKKKKLDLLILGSSRVLQFRKEMFSKIHSFYNAGYAIKEVSDFKIFLNLLHKENLPKCLIIGLDQWMFNSSVHSLKYKKDSAYWKQNNSSNIIFGIRNIPKIYNDVFTSRISFNDFKYDANVSAIGLNAYLHGIGFRKDGSSSYGTRIQKLLDEDSTVVDYKFNNTIGNIKKNASRFQSCKIVNPKAIEELKMFLEYCSKNNIYVIGLIPPFADTPYNYMIKTGEYSYLEKIDSKIRKCFMNFDFELYTFNSASDCGSSDSEFIDGFHGSERTYLKILIEMLKKGSELSNCCELEELKLGEQRNNNRYLIY